MVQAEHWDAPDRTPRRWDLEKSKRAGDTLIYRQDGPFRTNQPDRNRQPN